MPRTIHGKVLDMNENEERSLLVKRTQDTTVDRKTYVDRHDPRLLPLEIKIQL